MAISSDYEDTLAAALAAGTADETDFQNWAEDLIAKNQINAEVQAEIRKVITLAAAI